MKIAIIGAGRVARVHARAVAKHGCDIVVHDVDSRASHDLAQEVAGVVARSAADAFASADAAIIATPPATHAALVKEAVNRGLPVLCEKPLAESAASAEELAAYVAKRGDLVQVGFQRRFDSGYAAIHQAIRSGETGELHLLRLISTETGLAPSPKTNIFRNTAIHDFDLVRWLSGDEVVSIYVQGGSRTASSFDARLDPDIIIAMIRLARGGLAVATINRLSPAGYDARAEVLGSRDQLCTGIGPCKPLHFLDGFASETGAIPVWDSWKTRFADAFERQMSAFLEFARGSPLRGATLADAVAAQRIAEAARLSMEQESPVRFDPSL